MLEEVYSPSIRGVSLDYIPFIIFGVNSLRASVGQVPVLQLANVNLSHYRTSADYEHGLHFTSLPTPWLAGFDTSTKFTIGSSVAWISADPTAKASFLEYTGQGLGAVREALEHKEKQMAVLGARLLESEKRQVEAAESQQIRRIGENSIISSLSATTSRGLTRLMVWYDSWKNARQREIEYELSQEFAEVAIDATMLAQLMTAVQQGLMSYDSFFFNIKRAHMVPQSATVEEELDKIDKQLPGMLGTNPPLEEESEEEEEEEPAPGGEEEEEAGEEEV
jgi:hypothetical protein